MVNANVVQDIFPADLEEFTGSPADEAFVLYIDTSEPLKARQLKRIRWDRLPAGTGGGVSEARVSQLIAAHRANADAHHTPPAAGPSLATVLAAIMAGTDINIDRGTADEITINVMTTPTPTQHATLRAGISDDGVPAASELSIIGMDGQVVIPASMHKRHLLAKLASEGDITGIYAGTDTTNQLGAFTKYHTNVPVNSQIFGVWVSNRFLTLTSDQVWRVT